MTSASRDGRNATVTQAGRSAAITGAGSGLGRDIALRLAEKGYAVFGTAMTDAEVQASDKRVSLSLCDIAKEPDVKAWAGRVSAALGEGRGLDRTALAIERLQHRARGSVPELDRPVA